MARMREGDDAGATERFRYGLDRMDTLKPSMALAEALIYLGAAESAMGMTDIGLVHLQKGDAIARQVCPEGCAVNAEAQVQLGVYFYFREKQLREARDHFEAALNLWMSVPHIDTLNMTATMMYLGITSRELGEFTRALELYEQALAMRKRNYPDPSREIAMVYLNIAGIHYATSDYEKARNGFEAALAMFKKMPNTKPDLMAAVHNNLGLSMLESGMYAEAIANYEISRTYLLQQSSNHTQYCRSLLNEAIALQSMGRAEQAEAQFKKTMLYAREIDVEATLFAQIHQDYAYFLLDQGRHRKALEQIQASIGKLVPGLAVTDTFALPTEAEAVRVLELKEPLALKGEILAAMYKAQDHAPYAELALNCFDLAILVLDAVWLEIHDPGDKLAVNQEGVNLYGQALETAADLWAETGSVEYLHRILGYMERSKSQVMLESVRRARAAYLAGVPDSLHMRTVELQGRISELSNSVHRPGFDPDSAAMQNAALMSARMALRKHTDSLKLHYPAYSNMVGQREPISMNVLLKQYNSPQQMLVEYFISDSVLFVLSIWNGEVHFRETQLPESFSHDLQEFLAKLSVRGGKGLTVHAFQEKGTTLFQLLLAPELKGRNEIARIRIVPDGLLAALPFDVLPVAANPDAKDFSEVDMAISHYLISYGGSATLLSDIALPSSTSEPLECLGFAWASANGEDAGSRLPRPGQAWPNIPGTAKEITSIQQQIQGRYLLGMEANEAAFKQNATQYGMIHLALHGMAGDGEPILAFPATGTGEDGILYMEELYGLPLKARLTVLSACQTGLGKVQKGEGIMSMARGFGIAGCPSVVMSLWEVDDEATGMVMEGFYEGLAAGMEIDAALREAKLAYLKQAKSQGAPFYWAAFIPVGAMEAIPVDRNQQPWPLWLGAIALAAVLTAGIWWRNKRKKSQSLYIAP